MERSESGLKVRMNGLFKVESVSIDPQYLSTDKKEKLENALCSIFSNTVEEAQKRSASESKDLLKGFAG